MRKKQGVSVVSFCLTLFVLCALFVVAWITREQGFSKVLFDTEMMCQAQAEYLQNIQPLTKFGNFDEKRWERVEKHLERRALELGGLQ